MGSKKKIFTSTLLRELVRLFTMLLLVSFMVGGSASQAHAQKPGACGCADTPDMEARIEEAKAVIPLYQDEINRLKVLGKPVPEYTKQQYDQFQETLQPTLDKLANANGRQTFASGDTSMFCNVTPDPKATACMKASTITHENNHKLLCEQNPWSLITGTYKKQVGLIAVYENEIEAYDSEIKFLEDLRNRLKQPCSRGWHGQITMHYEVDQPLKITKTPGPLVVGGASVGRTEEMHRTESDTWKFWGGVEQPPLMTRGDWKGIVYQKRTAIEGTDFKFGKTCSDQVLHSELQTEETLRSQDAFGSASLFLVVGDGNGKGKVAHINIIPNFTDVPSKIISTQTEKGTKGYGDHDCGHNAKVDLEHHDSQRYLQKNPFFDAPVDPKNPNHLHGHLDIYEPPGSGAKAYYEWDLTLDSYPKVP